MINMNGRRVGVFIDVQNMYYSARNLFNKKVNFAGIVNELTAGSQLIRARAYTIATEEGQEEAFFAALHAEGIEVIAKNLLEYHSGAKKGDWDVGITVDIIRSLDILDEVILISGDGDFAPLVEYIKHRGRIAHVASFRESTSGLLVDAVDVYSNLSDDPEISLIADRRPPQRRSLHPRGPRAPRQDLEPIEPQNGQG